MKKKIDIKSLLLGALLGIAMFFSVAAATNTQAAWEYKVVSGVVLGRESKGTLDDVINASVAQGWQFVSAAHSMDRYGFAVMRREKQ
ncbi:MAG TPA: DUF4177 domain-containing protein [Candidatus Binatia bacterium]|nr:DUF4177 domain-containing protein [Candidatus Binatia bacterium]